MIREWFRKRVARSAQKHLDREAVELEREAILQDALAAGYRREGDFGAAAMATYYESTARNLRIRARHLRENGPIN